jgi:hypothetical protein
VNPGQCRPALLQVIVAGVDVGSLGERRVVVARPLADDREGDARVLHQRQRGVARVVQRDPAQPGPPEQPAELIGVPLRVDRAAKLVGDDVLPAAIPAKLREPVPVGLTGLRALGELELMQCRQRAENSVIQGQCALCRCATWALPAGPDTRPGPATGSR